MRADIGLGADDRLDHFNILVQKHTGPHKGVGSDPATGFDPCMTSHPARRSEENIAIHLGSRPEPDTREVLVIEMDHPAGATSQRLHLKVIPSLHQLLGILYRGKICLPGKPLHQNTHFPLPSSGLSLDIN